MKGNQYYIQVKKGAEASLFKIAGVRAVGLGPKYVAGRPAGILAIQVFVSAKLPLNAIAKEDIIPAFINDIPTDVATWETPTNMADDITVDNCGGGNIHAINRVLTEGIWTDLEITSPVHGLFNNAFVRFTGPDDVISNRNGFRVTVKDDDTFIIRIRENDIEISPLDTGTANRASWIIISTLDNLCCCPSGSIDFFATATDKVKIESSSHGLLSGELVKIQKSGPKLESPVYKIEKEDNNNFFLLKAKAQDFPAGAAGWSWRKVSIPPSGRIHRIEMTNPITIHSTNHGLVDGDKVVVQTIHNLMVELLDNLVSRIPPYEVKVVGPDTFVLKKVDASGWATQPIDQDLIGTWIKVIEDKRKYGRIWGGIRIEVQQSETETIERTTTNDTASAPLTTRYGKSQEVSVKTEIKLSTGTLGCLATDNHSGRRVLLSNAHVLFSGTNNDEVHHPSFKVSSKSCSKNRIADRMRMVFGPWPEDPSITVDAAIAKFDSDFKSYDPFIADIGKVMGTAEIQPTEIVNYDYRVWKRGGQTGLTEGIVTSVDLSFQGTAADKDAHILWTKQIRIQPIAGVLRGVMCIHGDSGSVVVNKENKVVGLLFKGDANGHAFANPIKQVEKALKIKIWTAAEVTAEEGTTNPQELQTAGVGVGELFANTLEELATNPAAHSFVQVIRRHHTEVIQILDTNKRFGAAWQRNYGPELLRKLREAVEVRDKPVPALIHGKPFRGFIINIFDALKKFGSPALSEDVLQYESLFLQLLNYSYEGMLDFLQYKSSAHENVNLSHGS